ncbi:MAG: phosphate signaling complex protein PhoU [Bacteroidetes bacterium]|nr:phosphate signaling complex protein PhoU [Bacteroidota bacterium]
MERKFDIELNKLNERLVLMSQLIQKQVSMTLEALVECDVPLSKQVVANDSEIDDLDVKIDKLCQRIFALQQPVASDLRFIMSALKINNDLERMGDLSVFIAKRVSTVSDFKEIINELKINELTEKVDKIVKDTCMIIETRRTVFVKDIFDQAQVIKEESRLISSRMIEQMMEKSDVILVATNLVQILGQIERMAAYSKNIAESVYFIVEGKIVKHTQFL